jgi:hypothetical protein
MPRSGRAQVLDVPIHQEKRFPLRHRASVKVEIEGSSGISGVTENVSGHGVLVYADSLITLGTGVEIVLVPKPEPAARKIQLIYAGKVLRSELLANRKIRSRSCL